MARVHLEGERPLRMYDVLKGIRVIEVGTWIFVPAAATVLADWGASVIRIEHPVTGDPYRGLMNELWKGLGSNPMMDLTTRGSRSIGLDLSSAQGRDILYRLIEDADVFLTNMLPGTREKLGISQEAIQGRNPNVVYAVGSGHGSRGPDAERSGFDLASSWARSGVAYQMTRPGGDPPHAPGSLGDLTGGLTLAGAIAAALCGRERDGRARSVEVSLYGVGIWWMAQAIIRAAAGVEAPVRTRSNPANPIVNFYSTQDARWLCLVMLHGDEWWPDLCRRIGHPELIDDPRFRTSEGRQVHAGPCTEALDAIFSEAPLSEWMGRLSNLAGVWAPVLSPREVAEDLQARLNGHVCEARRLDGDRYLTVSTPIEFDGQPIGELGGAPEHGQHTEEILLELGLSWSEIVLLKDSGAVL